MNFPSNPTGVTYNREEPQALADVLKQYDIFVLSDEIYSELTYGERHVLHGRILPEQTVLLTNGVSKSHAMTGWRIGLVCGPVDVISEIGRHQFAIATATRKLPLEEAFKTDPTRGCHA